MVYTTSPPAAVPGSSRVLQGPLGFLRVHQGSARMATLSSYARRMARLGAQIFGEVVQTETSTRSLKVVQLFREPPLAKRNEVLHWYPEHKVYFAMTQKLRYMGLYRYRLEPLRTG